MKTLRRIGDGLIGVLELVLGLLWIAKAAIPLLCRPREWWDRAAGLGRGAASPRSTPSNAGSKHWAGRSPPASPGRHEQRSKRSSTTKSQEDSETSQEPPNEHQAGAVKNRKEIRLFNGVGPGTNPPAARAAGRS